MRKTEGKSSQANKKPKAKANAKPPAKGARKAAPKKAGKVSAPSAVRAKGSKPAGAKPAKLAKPDHAAHVARAARSAKPAAKLANPGPDSLCPVSHLCGACQMLDVAYEEQLARKYAYMRGLFEGLAPHDAILPPIGMDEPFHYRNKVISPYAPGKKLPARTAGKGAAAKGASGKGGLGASADSRANSHASSRTAKAPVRREILTGMYAKGTHKLVPTDTCLLENEIAKKVTLAVRDIMARYDVAPYDEDAHAGFIRHAVVRVGHESGEVLVTLVTNGADFPSSKAFCRELVKRVPQITTVVQNVNERQTNVILGQQERTLYGPGFILDTLCGLSFRISSHSFYQVNATQTEVLYNKAIELAGLNGTECAIDAYCGTGTIGLVAAKRGAARVIGVDSVTSAIADARLNARHNGIENAEFVAADATEFMLELAAGRAAQNSGEAKRPESAGAAPDPGTPAPGAPAPADTPAPSAPAQPEELVLFMDPPRAGSTECFLDAAASMAPARIVYISCNPETQVRDIAYLRKHGYKPEIIQPVDMFPHTDHVESIALLTKG